MTTSADGNSATYGAVPLLTPLAALLADAGAVTCAGRADGDAGGTPTACQRAIAALWQSETQFRAVFAAAAIGIALVDLDGRIAESNRALQELLGYGQGELRGLGLAEVAHPDDAGADLELYRQLIAGARENYRVEKRYLRRDGQVVWGHLTVSLVRGVAGAPAFAIAMIEDISARTTLERQLRHQIFYDPLTNLPNRVLFRERLDYALRPGARRSGAVAVLFIDLDRFRPVNESLGHEAGDRLLGAVARRLWSCVRPGDALARFGGDKFTLLLEPVADARDAARVAERIAACLRAPFSVAGQELAVTASVGVALSAPGQDDPDGLLRDAELAMQRAKRSGAGTYAFFDPGLHAAAVARLALEGDLREAAERGELGLVYQPQVALADSRLVGVEALARWRHPERGPVSPGEFIPLAEETGLIRPLGRWVLETACRQALAWCAPRPADPPLTLSVNLSVVQLQGPELVADVARILAETGFPPDRLVLELTESTATTAEGAVVETMLGLKALGVRLAIDDFGTGYSSLASLQRLPVDILKLDRSFLAGPTPGPKDAALVRAVLAAGRALGLTVILEGIESAAQLAWARELGGEVGQGYYFARPLPSEEIAALIEERHTPAASPRSPARAARQR